MAQPQTRFVAFREDIRRTRRLLRRLPDTARDEVVGALQREGPAIEAYGRSQAPRRSGRLASALRFVVLPKLARARFGIIGRKLNRDLFYGRILELGRKAGTSRPIQRRLKNGGLSRRYTVRVSPIARGRYDFVFGRAALFARARIREAVKAVWAGALKRAAGRS